MMQPAYAHSLEPYKRTEQRDGVVYDMFPTPSFRHANLNGRIYAQLVKHMGRGPCKMFIALRP